jgi:Tfp pilus assembly protein PilV
MLEVLVAIAVLVVGLMASALLMTRTYQSSVRSRYMAEAAQLASEKLEDLSRFPAKVTAGGAVNVDPHIFVPSGENDCGIAGENCVGSINPAYTCTDQGSCTANAAASPQNITASQVGAGTYGTTSISAAIVNYSDAVSLATANGTMSETYESTGGGTPAYTSLTYSPNGVTPVPKTTTTAPTTGETFDRRWTIEQDQPVAGVRRITVLVTLMDTSVKPALTFQMSMVRP